MMKYNTIIWDMDGTLLDTLRDLSDAVNHTLRVYGLPLRDKEEVRRLLGNGVRNLMRGAVPGGEKNPRFEDMLADFKAYYVNHCRDHTGPYEGIVETLQRLREMGVKMAVVSNKLQAGVDELWETHFRDTIDVAIGERPGMARKPAPDMVQLALRDLGAEGDDVRAVYIGDSEVDIATARNSSLDCISVTWGFRDRDWLEEQGATVMADKPADIVEIISGGR
jgi:phosphoglycolate phosphatase